MGKEYHKTIHEMLHESLKKLAGDFIFHTEKLYSEASLMEFMLWSEEQTKNPTEKED